MFSKFAGKTERTDEETRRREGVPGQRPAPGLLERLVLGMKGGLIATLVMTAFRIPISRSLPPTAEFWAKYVGGGDPEQYTLQAIVLHLFYGTVTGGVFGAIFARKRPRGEARREIRGVVWGTAYALVLSAFGSRVLLERLLDMDLEPDERLVFHLGHVVYGLTLGTWLGSRE